MSAAAEAIANYWETHATEATEKQELFLQGLRETGTVLHAAELAGINRVTAYQWRRVFPEFRLAWDIALEDATDKVERSLFNQAVSEKNVVATIFYLKNNRHKYRERVTVDVVGMQSELEDKAEGLRQRVESGQLRLPSANLKDLIHDAMGVPRPAPTPIPVTTPGSDSDHNPQS